jgi:hypothetical protein
LVAIKSGERWFAADLSLAAAAFGGGFFRGGKGEETREERRRLSDSDVSVRLCDGFELCEECSFGECHSLCEGKLQIGFREGLEVSILVEEDDDAVEWAYWFSSMLRPNNKIDSNPRLWGLMFHSLPLD